MIDVPIPGHMREKRENISFCNELLITLLMLVRSDIELWTFKLFLLLMWLGFFLMCRNCLLYFFSTCFYIYQRKYVLMLALQSTSVNYLRRYFRLYKILSKKQSRCQRKKVYILICSAINSLILQTVFLAKLKGLHAAKQGDSCNTS